VDLVVKCCFHCGGELRRVHRLRNGRCKFHGGMSTGPKTSEGRARALANLRQNRSDHQQPNSMTRARDAKDTLTLVRTVINRPQIN